MKNSKEIFQSNAALAVSNGILIDQSSQSMLSKLSDYYCVIPTIEKKNHPRVFTFSNRGMSFVPEVNLTLFGKQFYPLTYDVWDNPYFMMRHRFNISLHPSIELLEMSLKKYLGWERVNRNHINLFAEAIDHCLADLKVYSQHSRNIRAKRSWETRYSTLKRQYHQFIETIIRADKFEIHSLCINLKPLSGDTYFQVYGFNEIETQTMINNICKDIITKIWRKKANLKLLGILSKWEMRFDGTLTKKLFFFIKKESSDWIPFSDTAIYAALQPFTKNSISEIIDFNRLPFFSASNTPTYQGQAENYYDINQMYVGDRLDLIQAYFVGTDFWFRINGNTPTLTIEKIGN